MNKPAFLGHMFVARGGGFFMKDTPPLDLLDEGILHSRNNWLILAAIVERSKHGDFSATTHILDVVRSDLSAAELYACADIFGHIAPSSVLKDLLAEFRADIFDKGDLWKAEFVLDICRRSMRLWTVPYMLEIYLQTENREEINQRAEDRDQPSLILLPSYLSDLLEEESGPIDDAELDDPDYGRLVMQKYDQLCKSYGSPELAVLQGKLFSVESIARNLLAELSRQEGPIDELKVAEDRMLFEASTGIDCRGFFDEFNLRPLAAAAILEDFLNSGEAAKCEPGLRCFFGHRIPD